MSDTVDVCSVSSLMTPDQALTQMLEVAQAMRLHAPLFTNKVLLSQACGRVLAVNAVSPINVPPHDNSAMDGYAIALSHDDIREASHIREASGTPYQLVGVSQAGHPYAGKLAAGECIRIMTGAPIPAGADLVEMQENAVVSGNQVRFSEPLQLAANIRYAGEDIEQGHTVLPVGRRLTPADCGLLASVGGAEVTVYRPLQITLLTTGDELVAPGQPLAPGQIYQTNSFVLQPILERLGADVTVLTAVPDELGALAQVLSAAAAKSDVIISSGGVSVGDADFTRAAIESLGELTLWRMAMKPGKPLAFGRIEDCLVLGLPGNPVSSLVTLHQMGIPLLRCLAGESYQPAIRMVAVAAQMLRKAPGRVDYQRGIASVNSQGQLQVVSTGAQGSGILTSVSQANCFIVLEQTRGRVEAGEQVTIEMFDQWLA